MNAYAFQLLVLINKDSAKTGFTPFQGITIIGVTNAISSILPLLYNSRIARRPVFFVGSFTMVVVLAMCGVSSYNEWSKSGSYLLIAFIFLYNCTNGAKSWLYVYEVCTEMAVSVTSVSTYFNLMILFIVFPYMVDGPMQVYGTMLFFACI